MLLIYISGFTRRRDRRGRGTHQLYLTGTLERDRDAGNLFLNTPDAGSYVLIGSKAGEIFDSEGISAVTIEGRVIRTRKEVTGVSIVEVLDYTTLKK